MLIEKIIQDLRKGSHGAFNILYDMYADSLYGFVLANTKSPSLSEDIVQETFLKLWNYREQLKIEGSFKALLFLIAKQQMINTLRKQINQPDFEEYIKYCDSEKFADNSAEEKIFYDDFQEKLNKIKHLLSDRQREVFELSKIEGLKNKEIAEKLNISEQTVKNQLSAALKILRSELIKYHPLFIFLL
ncbi:RNA polymerase sigma factor [Parabacteroides sp. Marseille-P3160]|uniref:RNA polymerase sigma factor n=1 Tax=Parabacteroides sp. Marseille-P3160 TaxID=1917887 RepID=UPI0009B985F5|nr:RNA polymerase sigma-70 factor [Parabacteroides sp. Marseille-P3160]